MSPNDVNDIWMNKSELKVHRRRLFQFERTSGGNVAQEPPACCEWKFLPTQLCKGRMIKKHILPVKALQR